ncbi:hypothetical protein N9F93_00990 [bacterium]|nr:hypothetical protein [bacterium]
MSTDRQDNGDDLFDFPEAVGVDSFGFEPEPHAALGDSAAHLTQNGTEDFGGVRQVEPIQNPPIPEGISDLEYDLFDFESASNTPNALPQSTAPFVTPSDSFDVDEALTEPSKVDVNAPAFASSPEDAAAEPAPVSAAAATKEPTPATHTASLLSDRGPRITLPEDMPGASAWERNRSLAALVGCFLLINTGIFFLAQQASDRFNQTIADATGLMAQVLLDQQAKDAQAAAPANAEAKVEHVIEAAPAEPAVTEAIETIETIDDTIVEPLEYDNTHQLGVARAKALLEQGKPEEARMLLNFILANRDRVPMRNSLREEIDYLIPFTYFEQGNLIAPEEAR